MIAADTIAAGARIVGVELTAAQTNRLARLAELLGRWSGTFNLISKSDRSRLLPRHLLDSLSLTPLLEGARVLDVGTGPGLPGLPLAIAAPARRFVLLDRSERKLRFVRQAIVELGIDNAQACLSAVETYTPSAPFDTIVARAVGSPAALWRAAARLLAPGGRFLVLCGDPARLELPAGVSHETRRVDIPGLTAPHWILSLRGTIEAVAP